jgi:ribosomal protein S4
MQTSSASRGRSLEWYALHFLVLHAIPTQVLQSWSPRNLFNLYQRCLGSRSHDSTFLQSSATLNQQRWTSKSLIRGYHGDYIKEKIFKRWYLPTTIPDVRPKATRARIESVGLAKWSRKESVVDHAEKQREEEEQKGLPPVGSLMLAEVERRIDVFIFRACLSQSVYDARRLVIHGYVLLNGRKVCALVHVCGTRRLTWRVS